MVEARFAGAGMLGLVVDAARQRILNADAALGSQVVMSRIPAHLVVSKRLFIGTSSSRNSSLGGVRLRQSTGPSAVATYSWNHTNRGYG